MYVRLWYIRCKYLKTEYIWKVYILYYIFITYTYYICYTFEGFIVEINIYKSIEFNLIKCSFRMYFFILQLAVTDTLKLFKIYNFNYNADME